MWNREISSVRMLKLSDLTSSSLMHETRHSKPVHWDNPEGWDGEGGGMGSSGWGTHVHPWLIHVNVWQKHHNIVE